MPPDSTAAFQFEVSTETNKTGSRADFPGTDFALLLSPIENGSRYALRMEISDSWTEATAVPQARGKAPTGTDESEPPSPAPARYPRWRADQRKSSIDILSIPSRRRGT